MARDKVEFSFNVPQSITIASPGELQPGTGAGTDRAPEFRYFLGDNRIMWVPEHIHLAIEDSAAETDHYEITRSKPNGKPATWRIQPVATAANLRPQPAPAPTQPSARRQTIITQPAEQPLTAADQLAGAWASAIDVAIEAAEYAKRKGLLLAFTAGDIRAMAATLHIGGRQ